MEGEARVLEQRVEVAPVDGRRKYPLEGVGGEQRERQEADRDPGLDRQHPGAQARRQIAAEARDRRAEHRQDQHPEHHGALVVAPDAGHLVEHGLGGVGVDRHVGHGEVGGHIGVHQREEGAGDEDQLQPGRRASGRHPGGIAARGADQRHHALDDGDGERQDQREVADLRNH
jgi:hypothetical protein